MYDTSRHGDNEVCWTEGEREWFCRQLDDCDAGLSRIGGVLWTWPVDVHGAVP